jgi:hypothetical protein
MTTADRIADYLLFFCRQRGDGLRNSQAIRTSRWDGLIRIANPAKKGQIINKKALEPTYEHEAIWRSGFRLAGIRTTLTKHSGFYREHLTLNGFCTHLRACYILGAKCPT